MFNRKKIRLQREQIARLHEELSAVQDQAEYWENRFRNGLEVISDQSRGIARLTIELDAVKEKFSRKAQPRVGGRFAKTEAPLQISEGQE